MSAVAVDNRLLAGRAGAVEAVVIALRAHINNLEAAFQACKALWYICCIETGMAAPAAVVDAVSRCCFS